MGTIAVVDYGMGNLRSVAKALEHVAPDGCSVHVTDDPAVIAAAERVVFPGQGAARDCMRAIDERGLRAPLLAAMRERPFFGMCMGLQVLLTRSEENGGTPCLGVFAGTVRAFPADLHDDAGARLKVPHMGWNEVCQTRGHPLWDGIDDGARFYFVHGYHAAPQDASLVVGTTDYGRPFCSALAQGSLFACQFHPEKSSAAGLRLLQNFVHWNGEAAEGAAC